MKNLITILLMVISTVCFSQVKSETLIGKWKFDKITNLQDSIIESSVKEFELDIMTDGTFKMIGETIKVSGTWQLRDSLLVLDGKRQDESESKMQKMKINKISETRLSIEFSTENQNEALLNLIKMK